MITEPIQSGNHGTKKRTLSISVVVPTCNRNASLECCLEAVSRLKLRPEEVLVVDSAPQGDGAREVTSRWSACYIRENMPGASRARNRGAQVARGDIVAFTDDDAAPDEDWLGWILPEFSDPRVALVAGKAIAPPLDPKLICLYELCGLVGQGNDRLVVDRDTPHWFEQVSFLPFGIGPNLAIRRRVLQHWRGFDERLGPGTPVPGQEEQRAFLQLIELGFRLVYTPDARVAHPQSARSAEELRQRVLCRMEMSAAYLTLLMVEEPRHRREVLGYIIRKLSRRLQRHVFQDAEQIPTLRRIMARLRGPGLYLKTRSQRRVSDQEPCSPA